MIIRFIYIRRNGMRCLFAMIASALIAGGCTVDSSLKPSQRTLDEAQAFIKPQMSPDEFQRYLQTSPILVRKNRLHWMLKDGDVWTDLGVNGEGQTVIVGAVAERAR